MKILFLEDYRHFQGFNINLYGHSVTYSGYWKIPLRLFSLEYFDVVVSTIQHSKLSRSIIQRANILGIRTVLIVDGIFEWRNSFDNPFVNKYGLKLFTKNIYDYVYICADDNVISFLKGNDDVIYSRFLNHRIFSHHLIDEEKKSLKKNAIRVLISFANNPCFDDVEKVLLIELVHDVCRALKAFDVAFDFRIYDEEMFLNFANYGADNITKGTFGEVVQEYSALISTPSSVTLEAIRLGIPTAQLYYRSTPQSFQTPWTIHQGVNFSEVIHSLLNPNYEHIRFQENLLSQHIGNEIDFSKVEQRKNNVEPNELKFLYFEVFQRLIYEFLKKHIKNKTFFKRLFKK